MTNPCRNDQSCAYTVLHDVPSINTRTLYAVALNSIARKGVQRVENPLAGSRGSAPWVPQSTRGHSMKVRSTQSRERVKGGTPLRGQGAARLGFLNQHAGAVCSRAQLNREKGVQRVEDPLAGSRGRAPWVPQSTRGRCMQSRATQSRKGSPEGRRPFGGVKGQSPLGSPINTRALYAVALNSIAKRESRGSKTLWQVQGRALPESRGRASGASFRKELL